MKNGAPKIVAGIIVLLAVLLLVGIVPRIVRQADAKSEAKTSKENGGGLPSVLTTLPVAASKTVELTLPGSIEPINVTGIGARTGGYVRRVYVDIGDRVRAGQVLADIESPEVDQQARASDANLAKSVAGVAQAQSEIARAQANVAQMTAQKQRAIASLAQARAQRASSVAGVAQARAARNRAVSALETARQNVDQQQANLKEAQTNRDLAKKDWDRWQQLVKEGAVAQEAADQHQTTYLAAQSHVESLQATLKATQSGINAAQDDIKAADATVQTRQAEVTAADANIRAFAAAVTASGSDIAAAQAALHGTQSSKTAANAGVAASQADTARYGVLRGFEQVRAPFAGIITARRVVPGSLVSAVGTVTGSANSIMTASTTPTDSSLFTLAQGNGLRVVVSVPQSNAAFVRLGQTATIAVRDLNGKAYSGIVARTASLFDPTSRTLRTEVTITDADKRVVPGMYADVTLSAQRTSPQFSIPSSALITGAKGAQVAVVEGGKVHYLDVIAGRDNGRTVEITQGLEQSQPVIANPSNDLREGTSVTAKPMKETTEGGAGKKGKKAAS